MTTTFPDETMLLDDADRLRAAAAFVREHDSATLLPLLLPGLGGPDLKELAEHCRFAHAGVLLFPPDTDGLRAQLADCGMAVDTPSHPSVVVRERLARRHQRDPAELDVRILRPQVHGAAGESRAVEVFALIVPPNSGLERIAAYERTRRHEAHLAFEIEHPDPLVLRDLCAILARHGARPDGGGYNPHEDGTVLYFTTPSDAACGYRRLELYAHGGHHDALAPHLDHSDGYPRPRRGAPQPAETLLHMLTGAWTTQALASFARLRLPDAMDTRTAHRAEDLARLTGTHPRSLATLLRYLVMLGVIAQDDHVPDLGPGPNQEGGFRLTELGALLRADAPASMRPLALMYGGPFYHSFGGLDHAVRTGQPAFDHHFGENHFDHFARDPDLADLFDRSMAASSRMFQPLPAHPAITAAAQAPAPATVIDVAGGNGALLGHVLTAHPSLRGVLLERPHAVAAARRLLDAAGCGALRLPRGRLRRRTARRGRLRPRPRPARLGRRPLPRDPSPLRPGDARSRRPAHRRTPPARRRFPLAGHRLGPAHAVQRRRPRTARRPLRAPARRRRPPPPRPHPLPLDAHVLHVRKTTAQGPSRA